MKKTIATIATTLGLMFAAGTAQAETYSSYEECLNSQGKFFASMRKSYCSDPAKIVTPADKQTEEDALLGLYEEIYENNVQMAKLLTYGDQKCAARIGGRNGSYIQCTDPAGTWIHN